MGDGDTGGNGLQNFPVSPRQLLATATLPLAALSTAFPIRLSASNFLTILLYNPSGNGEGQTYLNFVNVTTDAAGNANFTSPPLTATGAIVTTATNLTTNDTSEFSQHCPGLLQFSNPAYTVNENGTVVGAGNYRQSHR